MKTYELYTGNGSSPPYGNRSASEIERDLGSIRAEMSHTLEEIQQRFSPGELLDHALRGLRRAGRGSSDVLASLGESLKDNPVPLALIGTGLAYLAVSTRSHGHEEHREAGGGSSLKERLSGAADRAKETTSSTFEQARGRIAEARGSAREAVSGALGRARGAAGQASERARERARNLGRTTSRVMHDQPLLVAGLGIAIGALLGAALPPTRREDEVLGPRRDELAHKARQVGEEVQREAESVTAEPASGAVIPEVEEPRH